jgi:hypothetical protein
VVAIAAPARLVGVSLRAWLPSVVEAAIAPTRVICERREGGAPATLSCVDSPYRLNVAPPAPRPPWQMRRAVRFWLAVGVSMLCGGCLVYAYTWLFEGRW